MKIKLSKYTPRKEEWIIIIIKVITLTRKITLEYLTEVFLVSYSLHVMRKDTSPDSVPETKVALKRKKNYKRRHHAHTA